MKAENLWCLNLFWVVSLCQDPRIQERDEYEYPMNILEFLQFVYFSVVQFYYLLVRDLLD